MIPYFMCIVKGPYKRKDGRKTVSICLLNGKWKTVSYPKYLMEIKLGRYLTVDETVDHIDQDFTNDSLDNLQVLIRKDHAKLDVLRLVPQDFKCPVCNKGFTLSGMKLHYALSNRKRKDCTGPYCSRRCAGKRSKVTNEIVREFTTNKSLNRE